MLAEKLVKMHWLQALNVYWLSKIDRNNLTIYQFPIKYILFRNELFLLLTISYSWILDNGLQQIWVAPLLRSGDLTSHLQLFSVWWAKLEAYLHLICIFLQNRFDSIWNVVKILKIECFLFLFSGLSTGLSLLLKKLYNKDKDKDEDEDEDMRNNLIILKDLFR